MVRAATAPRTTRVTALAAGTFSLLALAALVLVVTPRGGSPIAVGSSTTLFGSAAGSTSPRATVRSAGVADISESSVIGIAAPISATSGTTPAALAALATPIGDGSLAVVTARSLAGQRAGLVSLRLRSGATATGQIVAQYDDKTLVAMEPTEYGHRIARVSPKSHDMVTVMDDTPRVMPYSDVAHMDMPEGTAIVDSDGELVGLCSRAADGSMYVVAVDELDEVTIVSSTTTSLADVTTTIATTVPVSSTIDASVTTTTFTTTTVVVTTTSPVTTTTTIAAGASTSTTVGDSVNDQNEPTTTFDR